MKLLIPMIAFVLLPALLWAQPPLPAVPDSAARTLLPAKDTAIKDTLRRDTAAVQQVNRLQQYNTLMTALLQENTRLNSSGTPIMLTAVPRRVAEKNYLFYLLLGLTALLAMLRFFYARYFSNLFRVFFNTSLRQSQLTDQLLQAKLPSLLYNLLFVLSGGFFMYLVLQLFGIVPGGGRWWLTLPLCMAALGIIYAGKYCTLRFTGWITSYSAALDTYTFVIFLINKIIGILLVPMVVIMAFAAPAVARGAALTAGLVIGLLLLLRFFKSYGLLQGQVKVSRFHFALYILGVEILPLFLIYKLLVIYFTKRL